MQPMNQPMLQPRKMREEFRVAIRRQKKQQIFRSLRSQNRVLFIEQEQKKMISILDTCEKREEWILRKARDLSGDPDLNWRFIMNELFWSILCFKGEGSFNIWITSGIIKSLCTLFYEDNMYLNLAPEAAKLLGNIIFLEEEQEERKASLVAKEIFEQEIVDNLVVMVDDKSLPHSEISFLVTLMGNLALNDAKIVIQKGALRACIDWSLRILKESKVNRAYLDQIYTFFRLLCYHVQKIPANFNFADQVIKLYTDFIELNQSNELIDAMLETIGFLASHFKQPVYNLLLNNYRMMKKIFELSTCDHESIRQRCWDIFAYLSSAQKVKDTFLNFQFMNVMWQAYGIEAIPNGNFDKITQKMLMSIGNIAAQSDQMRDQLLRHSVMNIIYDSTHEQRSMNVKKNAYYTLCTFLSTNNYNLCRKILFETPIFEKIVFALDHLLEVKDSLSIKDILKTLLKVFRDDRQVYRYHGESILEILEVKYSIGNRVQQIQEVYHGNARISTICDEIFDMGSTD